MTNAIAQDAVKAAAPELISALQAFQQFETDMGVDPAQWVVRYPGAKLKLLGTVALLLPQVVTGEVTALQAVVNTTTNGWIAKLQSLQTAT